ncbi:hypothetical protein ACRAKI_13065 [Saccharothrix isguenensis]
MVPAPSRGRDGGRSIADVLETTIEEAVEQFDAAASPGPLPHGPLRHLGALTLLRKAVAPADKTGNG